MAEPAGRGGAVRDDDVAVGSDFGERLFKVEAAVEAAAVAPDEDGEGGGGEGFGAVDGVFGEVFGGGVGCGILSRLEYIRILRLLAITWPVVAATNSTREAAARSRENCIL